MSSTNILREKALRYAAEGWHILPCRERSTLNDSGEEVGKVKAPYLPGGFNAATTDTVTIQGWWKRWPGACIGISTGPSGLLVIDLDNKHGVDGVANFEALAAQYGGIPKTTKVRTQSGGWHLYFQRPATEEVPSRNGWLPGVDVRAATGYVLAPPSRIVGGGEYRTEVAIMPAMAPAWLLDALKSPDWKDAPAGQKKPFTGQISAYASAVLKAELEGVRTATEGCRNATLNRTAFILFGWVAGGELPENAVQEALEEAAKECGLPQVEALKTISSGKRAGLEHPRNCPQNNIHGTEEPPLPLRRPTKPQAPYPTEAFLDFEDALVDVAKGLNVPLSMAGNSMLGALDLLTQPIANVQTRRFSETPLSLFLMSVAESGDGKSETESVFMKPIERYEREEQKKFKEAYRDYLAERASYERELENLKRKRLPQTAYSDALKELMRNEPRPPLNPISTIGDPNIEGIYRFLSEGKPHVGLFTDEGARLFGGTAFAQENVQRTIGALTAVWSGKALDKMRYGDGTTKLFDRRICSHIMMQPVIAEKLFSDALLAGQGYLFRQLVTWPAPLMKSSTQVDVENLPSLKAFYAACDRLLAVPLKRDPESGGIIFDTLSLTEKAHAEYDRFFDHIEENRQEDHEYAPVNGYAKRTAEQALRIAGVLALAHDPAGRVIQLETMTAGIRLAEWYLDEVLRIALEDMTSPEIAKAEKLLRWYVARGIETTSVRQVLRVGPGGLREKKAVETAIRTLEDHGWLVSLPGGAEVWEGTDQRRTVRKAWKVRLDYAVQA